MGVSVGGAVSVGVLVGPLVGDGVTGAGVSVGVDVSIMTMIGVGGLEFDCAPMLATTSGVADAVADLSAIAKLVAGGVAVGVVERDGVTVALVADVLAGAPSPALAAAPLRRRSSPPIVPRQRNNTPNSAAPVRASSMFRDGPVDDRSAAGTALLLFLMRRASMGAADGNTGVGAASKCSMATGCGSFR
jgi:hypothetical protein